MSTLRLGKLTKVSLREVWKHEALHFTQWLALPENIELLSEAIGMDLVNIQTEVGVGQFFVDILAEDENGHRVIIENQLEPTNHDHLGKIITYAAGLQSKTLVWIVERAREEHEQAISWLNEHTDQETNFFLLQIEAWQIGDSPPAPRFNIIAKPNDWAKAIKQTATGNALSEVKLQQQAFFERVRKYGEEHAKHIRGWQTPQPQHWYNIRVGSSRAHIAFTLNSLRKQVSVELYISNDKELFARLLAKRDDIEAKLGQALDWRELPGKKASRIIVTRDGNFLDERQSEMLVIWLVATADNFARTFPHYL